MIIAAIIFLSLTTLGVCSLCLSAARPIPTMLTRMPLPTARQVRGWKRSQLKLAVPNRRRT